MNCDSTDGPVLYNCLYRTPTSFTPICIFEIDSYREHHEHEVYVLKKLNAINTKNAYHKHVKNVKLAKQHRTYLINILCKESTILSLYFSIFYKNKNGIP